MILAVNGCQWQFSIAMLSYQGVTPWNLQGNCMEYYSPGEWKPLGGNPWIHEIHDDPLEKKSHHPVKKKHPKKATLKT